MTEAINRFFAAWSDIDGDGRADLIRSAVSGSFRYTDPHTPDPITSVEGMLEFLGGFPPGASARVIEPIDRHHGHARVNVAFDFGEGKSMVGQYFADLDADGKIVRAVGFPGKGAE